MRDRIYIFLVLLAGALALLTPGMAAAQETRGSICHAYSDEVIPLARALDTVEWRCDGRGWEDGHAVTWLRFENRGYAQPPRLFATRTTVFDSIDIAVVDDGRILDSERHLSADATPVPVGPIFTLALPETSSTPDAYLVRIIRPHSVTVGSGAALWSNPIGGKELLAATVILALVTGMLVMPLLFDAMFYLVLRERFVLFHAGMVVAMILYALSAGGVIAAFWELPVDLMARMGPVAWAVGVAMGGLFMREFIERDKLPHWQRQLLLATAVWALIVPGFAGLQLAFSQSFDNQLYFAAFVPVVPIYMLAIVTALVRGSRAAKFLAVAWVPMVLASIERLLRGMGFYADHSMADLSLFVSLAGEVIIVGLGIADRFLAVRRERDRALTEARTLEELTERDPLTGLLNRRAIEERFTMLRADGFTTLAAIDLDNFKDVNDRHGHMAGDQVLRCVAQALRPDDDALVFRLGGEEFVLLLRGKSAFERAEDRRIAITQAVADAGLVPEPLTASMGLVEAPFEAMPGVDFDTLYQSADRLLYEAKAGGRNRSITERLKVFHQRRRSDRRAA